MAIYLDQNTINDLIQYRNGIFKLAEEVYSKHKIDILTNDTLNALSIHEIVSVYDKDYNTNFHRHDEDAKSNEVLIENKCSTVKPNKKGLVGKSVWQFHAQGKLNYDRYIFAIRRKDNLEIVRLYDITSKTAIDAVQNCLAEMKQKWIDKGKPNHDAIMVPEKLLLEIPVINKTVINNCEVVSI
jgi:hypothetical protein